MKPTKPAATPQARAKVATGIPGFDELSYGGLHAEPHHACSWAVRARAKPCLRCKRSSTPRAERSEPGIFVAFEETTRQIIANAAGFDWGLPALAKSKLFFLDAHLSPEVVQSGEFDLSGMLAMLKAKKEEIGARWIVFDGIDVLLDVAAEPGRGNARDLSDPRLVGGQRD